MRVPVALLAGLAACVAGCDPGPGLDAKNAELAADNAVTQCAAKSAADHDEIAALKAQVAMMMATRPPVLVAKLGTPDEVVIGLAVGPACAVSKDLGGMLCFDRTDGIVFSSKDCTGPAFVDLQLGRPGRLVRASDGTVYQALQTTTAVLGSSSSEGHCTQFPPGEAQVKAIKPVGMMPFTADDVIAVLR
jgi:hypothetical protein